MIEFRRTRTLIEDTEKARKNLGFRVGIWDKTRFCHSFLAIKEINSTTIAIPRNLPLKEFHYSTDFDELQDVYLNIPFRRTDIEMKKGVGWHPTNPAYAKTQEEAFNYFIKYIGDAQRMLNLTTGAGKTFVAIKYITHTKYATLVVVDQLPLLNQWIEEFTRFTNLTKDDIHHITGIKGGEDIIHRKLHSDKAVYITTYKTLSMLIDKDIKYFDKLMRRLKIGLKILDEAHLEIDALFKIDASADVYETFYLTATPNRSQREEDVILQYMISSGVSYDNYAEAVPYHNIMVIEYDSKPSMEVEYEIAAANAHGFNVNMWSDYIFENYWKEFTAGIFYLMQDAYTKSFKKTVIILKSLRSLQQFAEDLGKVFPEYSIGHFYGTSKKKSLELDKDIIITTDKSMKAGIDVKGLKFVINTVTYSSAVVAEQIIGRIREVIGQQVVYIDYADVGFEKTRAQKNRRVVIYKQLAKKLYTGKYPPTKG